MSKKEDIQAELKTAMLAHDDFVKTTLAVLKSAILYEEVAKNKRDEGLTDAEIESVAAREVKKREDAAKLYRDAGAVYNASKEEKEAEIIAKFLPKQLSDDELSAKVREIAGENYDALKRGQLIGAVKKAVGNAADGARVAKAVGEVFAK